MFEIFANYIDIKLREFFTITRNAKLLKYQKGTSFYSLTGSIWIGQHWH